MDIPTLDCRGLVCPMPIIQVRLKTNLMKKGDRLTVLADDETFESEFARFCQLADIKLLEKRYYGDFYEYLIESIL
jgi:TusA-related sulfurtransferase